MSITLISKNGRELFECNNTAWCYILNLGELYGWKPQGTKKPRNYGLFKRWPGDYDSSDGQAVLEADSSGLALALKTAVADDNFSSNSQKLIQQLQEAIERSVRRKLDYQISPDVKISFINEVIEFLKNGEFTIN